MRFVTALQLWSLLAVTIAQVSVVLDQGISPSVGCPDAQIVLVQPSNYSGITPLVGVLADVATGGYLTELVFPPTVDLASSIAQGVSTVVNSVTTIAQHCPQTQIVLIGYSQGATYITAALAGTNFGGSDVPALSPVTGQHVKAIVVYSDALQASQGQQAACPSCTTGSPLERTGTYYDTLEAYADRLQSWCGADDPMCCRDSDPSLKPDSSSYLGIPTSLADAVWFVAEKLNNTYFASAFNPKDYPSMCPAATSLLSTAPVPTTTTTTTTKPTSNVLVSETTPTLTAHLSTLAPISSSTSVAPPVSTAPRYPTSPLPMPTIATTPPAASGAATNSARPRPARTTSFAGSLRGNGTASRLGTASWSALPSVTKNGTPSASPTIVPPSSDAGFLLAPSSAVVALALGIAGLIVSLTR